MGYSAGRSGTSTDDSDDDGRQPTAQAAGAGGSQPNKKQACGSTGAATKEIIPNDHDFSIAILK